MKQYVWLDNKIVLSKDVDKVFYDQGFLYGEGLFETMRTYNGKVFLLNRHIDRMINSFRIMGINPLDKELLNTVVLETVKRNQLKSGYIRLNIWKKSKGVGIFVFTKDSSFYSKTDYQNGFSAIIIRDIRQNETSPLVRVKSLNHYFYILLGNMAKDEGVDEAIILNSKGNICEGTRTNIFIIKDDMILTPSIDCGCLAGITRQVTIEIAKQLDIGLKETEIKPNDLFMCREVFLTNSLIEVMPLTKIDGNLIGQSKLGEKTKLILERYRKLIIEDYK